MKLIVETPYPNIVHVRFEKSWEMNYTMCRVQEYYENPDNAIRGQSFSFEDLFESLAENTGELSYVWGGFNIPGNVINKFKIDGHPLYRKCEWDLWDAIASYQPLSNNVPWYLIATSLEESEETRKQTINHELAHAFYYLDKAYKTKMRYVINDLSSSIYLDTTKQLMKMGYDSSVVDDEVQAYLSTEKYSWLCRKFSCITSKKIVKPFKKVYKKYRKQNESK